MICNNGHEMSLEEVLLARTTSPLEDDLMVTAWWCDKCQESKPLEKEEDQYEND